MLELISHLIAAAFRSAVEEDRDWTRCHLSELIDAAKTSDDNSCQLHDFYNMQKTVNDQNDTIRQLRIEINRLKTPPIQEELPSCRSLIVPREMGLVLFSPIDWSGSMGNKIGLIRLVKDATGLGLKDTKKMVEADVPWVVMVTDPINFRIAALDCLPGVDPGDEIRVISL